MSFSALKTKLLGVLLGTGDITEANVAAAFSRECSIRTSAATATNAHGTLTVAIAPTKAIKVTAVTFCLDGTTLSATATNYVSVQLDMRASDGSTTTLVASVSSASTAITNGIRKVATVTTNNTVQAYETLCYQVVKGDITTSGVAASAGVLTVYYEEID